MINLLPDEKKDDIRAARINVILSRYITILIMAILFLMVVLYVSYTVLETTKKTADATVETNDVKADIYSGTKTQVDALSSKLNETKSILEQEVRYSKVLTALGAAMPAGTVIESLTLNEASFNGSQVPLKAYAKTNEAAASISTNLQSSLIITQVKLVGTDATKGIQGYPVGVDLMVTFNKARAK